MIREAPLASERRELSDLKELRRVLVKGGYAAAGARLLPLHGGVSSLAAVVDDAGTQWVVKTPRGRLEVADEWLADRCRGAHEAAMLAHLGGALGPVKVPRLLFFDEERVILGEELISGTVPGGPVPTYKEELLEGRACADVAAALGAAATVLHRMAPPSTLGGDRPREMFDALRLDPYYRATARRRPDVSGPLMDLISETIASSPRCTVHGDFTPKNVLVTGHMPALLDWEVAHPGDPSFDLGVFTAHLALKALRDHPPGGHMPPLAAARVFWATYNGPADRSRSFRHAGAVMLARLYGKSPVDYLHGSAARHRSHMVGERMLRSDNADIDTLLDAVRSVLRAPVEI